MINDQLVENSTFHINRYTQLRVVFGITLGAQCDGICESFCSCYHQTDMVYVKLTHVTFTTL